MNEENNAFLVSVRVSVVRILRSTLFINKRRKAVITSFGLAFFGYYTLFHFGLWVALIGVLFLTYFGTLWVLDFDLSGVEHVVFSVYSWMFSLLYILWLYFLQSPSLQWFLSFVYVVLLYVSLLTSNILNTATIRVVPLSRVAETVYYLLSTLISIIVWIALYNLRVGAGSLLFCLFFVTALLSFPVLWRASHKQGRRVNLFNRIFGLALLLTQIAAAMHFWPLSLVESASVFGLSYYVLTGSLEQGIQLVPVATIWKEYRFMVIIVMVWVVVSSRWGIFG